MRQYLVSLISYTTVGWVLICVTSRWTYTLGLLPGPEVKLRVNIFPVLWHHVDRPREDEPVLRDLEAADLTVAFPRRVGACKSIS